MCFSYLRIIILLVLTSGLFIPIGKASPYLDSLYEVYYQLPSNTPSNYQERIELLKAISDYELHENPLSALATIDTLAELYQLIGNDAKYYREKYRTKGFLYATLQNKLKALEYYQEYVKYCKKESTDDAYFLLDVGNIYFTFRLYNMAKVYYKEAEKIFEQHQLDRGLGTIYSNYSLIAQEQNQIDSALFYIEKTLYVQENDPKDRDLLQIAHTYQVIGKIYCNKLKDYPKGILYYQKALAIFSNKSLHKDPRRYNQFVLYWPYTSVRLGKAYMANNQLDSGLYYAQTTLQVLDDLGKENGYVMIAIDVAEIYLEQKNFEVAEELLLKIEALAIKNSDNITLERCYKALKVLHNEQEAYKKVIYYGELYDNLRDSIQKKQDEFFLITDGLLKYEKNERIEQQEQIIQSEKNVRQGLYIILFLTVSILLISLFLGLKLRNKNKAIKQYAKDLKSSNKIKETILSVIGHDLRSPFGAISNISGLLQKNLKDQNYEALNKLSNLLYTSSNKAYSMMDELMQWTTLQKETTEVSKQKVEIKRVVEETVNQLGILLEQGEIRVKVNVGAVSCWTDPILVQIILRNILTNAIKYTPFGGEIRIETQWKENTCVLQIEDGGVGIDEALLGRIFKAKNSLEVVKNASGLGLIIVRDLCEKIDWNIRAFNKKGGGAIFELGNLSLSEEDVLNKAILREKEEESLQILSNPNKLILEPYIQKLLNCEVFEATKIRRITQEIEEEDQEIINWLKRLNLIINQHDFNDYQSFLKSS